MKVLKRDIMPDGTKIQIDDWSKDYPNVYAYASTVGAYPVAKEDSEYGWIKRNQTFRLDLNFDNQEQAEQAFSYLLDGKKKLIDYQNYFHNGRKDLYYLTGDKKWLQD